jgi:hypothetical protein
MLSFEMTKVPFRNWRKRRRRSRLHIQSYFTVNDS